MHIVLWPTFATLFYHYFPFLLEAFVQLMNYYYVFLFHYIYIFKTHMKTIVLWITPSTIHCTNFNF